VRVCVKGCEFWTANVKNKFSQANKWFASANKKANFERLLMTVITA